MPYTLDNAIPQLIAAGKYIRDNGLGFGNAGNLSARLEGQRSLITASGTRLGELAAEDLVECPLAGIPAAAVRKPSKELPMHQVVYRCRPEINAVLHAAPFYSTLVACSDIELPSDWFVESMYYLERAARVPFAPPGSQALAEAVEARACQANILLLDNHGVLVYDTSLSEALTALHTLEMTARMYVVARQAEISLRAVEPGMVRDFLEHSGYRPRRPWPQEFSA